MTTAATMDAPPAPEVKEAEQPEPEKTRRMRLYVAKLKRRTPSPWEAYSLFLLIGAAIYIPLSYTTWTPPLESPLRYFGFACPLCGGTRAVTALCTGQFLLAIKYNPFAVVVFAFLAWGMFSYLLIVLPFKKRLVLEMTRRQIALFWVLVGCVVLANWAYVLWAGMYKVPLKI